MHRIFPNLRGNNILRFIDRYFFIPVVFLLGLFKHKKKLPQKIETIGIILLAAIGDSIVAIAPLMGISKKYPNAQITLFATKENSSVFSLFPHNFLIEIIDLRKIYHAISIIRKHHFDILIDCSQWVRISAVLSFFPRAYFTVGFKTANQFRHFVYDCKVTHSGEVHEIENYRNLVQAIGVLSNSLPQAIVSHEAQQEILQLNLGKYIVFHPWPSGYKSELKRWPQENWVPVAHYLLSLGYKIIVTGGKSDVTLTEDLLQRIGSNSNVVSLAGKLSLMEVAALLEKAELLITVNTGIMHLAAALNVQMLVLNGPVNSKRWGPLSNKAVVFNPIGIRCGYLYLGFEYPKNVIDCMQYISSTDVIKLLKDRYEQCK